MDNRPHIISIAGNGLSVCVVWVCVFDCTAENFVPEKLTDVGYGSSLDSVVCKDGNVGVGEKMGVCSTSIIMTWEDGIKGSDSVRIGSLNTSQEGRIVTTIGDISSDIDTTVDTSGVTVPDIDVDLGDGLACCDVDVLNLKMERDTDLPFSDVLADSFTENVVGTISIGRSQDTRGVSGKDGRFRCVDTVIKNTSLIVVDSFIDFKSSEITTELFGYCRFILVLELLQGCCILWSFEWN